VTIIVSFSLTSDIFCHILSCMEDKKKPDPEAVYEMRLDSSRPDVTDREIVQQLSNIAFVDIDQIIDDNGYLAKLSDIPADDRQAIQEINQQDYINNKGKPGSRIKVKMYDKLKALDALAKMRGMYKIDNEQQGQSLAQALAEIHKGDA